MSAEQPLRCARCGVESLESTCFADPERYSKPPSDVRCVTCERRRLAGDQNVRGVTGLALMLLWPLIFLARQHETRDGPLHVPEVLAAVMLFPAAILAHELGHAITALLLGLEVGAVDLGLGRVLLRFELGGVPVRMRTWPVAGQVILGARSVRLLRTRVWLATLMGPLTNGALLLLTARFWSTLEGFVGAALVSTWAFINFLMLCGNLVPFRTRDGGRLVQSDGLTLLMLPWLRADHLQTFLISAPATRAQERCERDDLLGAMPWFLQALERAPGHVALTVSLAACHSSVGEHARNIALLTPLLAGAAAQTAGVRAMLYNNLSFAHLMTHARSHGEEGDLAEAERLSHASFSLFPCVLELRATRAFVLAATGRAADALQLLEYLHYGWGTPRQRSAREVARAFALASLGRHSEAREAALGAARLHPESRDWLMSLGLPGAEAAAGDAQGGPIGHHTPSATSGSA